MKPARRSILKWALLTPLALALGASLGAVYSLQGSAIEESLGGPAAPEDGQMAFPGTSDRPRDRIPPTAPVPREPADGAFVATGRPIFRWEPSIDAFPLMYQIEFSADPAFAEPEVYFNIYEPEFTLPKGKSFPPLARIHWRLLAVDPGMNESPYSKVSEFTVLGLPS